MKTLVPILLALCRQAASPDRIPPSFNDFEVREIFKGVPCAPRFTNPKVLTITQPQSTDLLPDADPRYRDAVTLEESVGPNFAGHFTITPWSCGSGCLSMVIVDARSGLIYRNVPFGTLDLTYIDTAMGIEPGLSFRIDSSLLITEGCFDTDFRAKQGERAECGRNVYSCTSAAGFVLLSHVHLPRRQKP